jgi:DNA-directed RNA polymerase specialized sigma24 family protein
MSIDQELADTFSAIRGLRAERPDNLEDYYHDAIVHELTKNRELGNWLPYIYQCVYRRIGRGREGPMDLPFHEAVIPNGLNENIDLKIDIRNAFKLLTATQAEYIYEYFYDGYSLPEIAIRHHAAQQTVNRCIQRGLQRMKGAL